MVRAIKWPGLLVIRLLARRGEARRAAAAVDKVYGPVRSAKAAGGMSSCRKQNIEQGRAPHAAWTSHEKEATQAETDLPAL